MKTPFSFSRQILKCLRVDQRLGQITNVISLMIPQLAASGTTFITIFLFMTYIAYIFFGPNLEDWSTFIFSIGASIGKPNPRSLCNCVVVAFECFIELLVTFARLILFPRHISWRE
jgi:hypothetical protein